MPGHEGFDSNNFVTTQKYYDEHPKEIAFFASVWERGVQEWWANMPEIIKEYPNDFGWQNDEEYQWVVNYLTRRSGTSGSTPSTWTRSGSTGEDGVQDDAGATHGQIPADQAHPFYVAIDPETGEETYSFPKAPDPGEAVAVRERGDASCLSPLT